MSDFERTFGAGADAVAIINAFSNTRTAVGFDTKEVKFHYFSEASKFSKDHPGSAITKGPGRGSFIVTPPKSVSHFRFTDEITNRYPSAHAKPETFVIIIPADASTGTYVEALDDAASKLITRELVFNYLLRVWGEVSSRKISRRPPGVEVIKEKLRANGFLLVPISDQVCLIADDCDYHTGGPLSVDSALVNDNGVTELLHGVRSPYDLIV